MSRSLKAHILLVLVTFVWGGTFVITKAALRDCTPLLFNAIRFVLSAAILALFYHRQFAQLTAAAIRAGIVVGLLLCLGYQFQTLGLRLTTPSKSAFLTGSCVVLVPVFLVLFWRRRVNSWTLVGVAGAFVGLYLLAVPGGESVGLGMNVGDLLTIGCAVAFAFQIIALGRATQKHAFEQIVLVEIVTCAVVMLLCAALLEPAHVIWSQTVLWALVANGLFGTCAAFVVQGWAQQFTPPSHAALIFSLEPVAAWAVSFAVGERLGLRATVGAILILVGVAISELLGHVQRPEAELTEEVR